MSIPNAKRPDEFADLAAEAIRSLNHLTIGGTGYREAHEVDAVIAHLMATVHGMEQSIAHVMRWLHAAYDGGRLAHDADLDLKASITQVSDALMRSGARLDRLDDGLNDVRRVTAHLKTITPGKGTEH
ncbi:hypothetical protein [Kineosporia sp. NBRC 101731]|uniref:hypothetical protein n=1 Tax=Kineosporia sp. NBRC 101731 TaxID=3032199 RepID=UPI00249FB970|nr:hypothetical protein [Kineosporia sp. NBRC 101731]GLY33558.1 hypothetical protein Kisp02_69230 [Kineosporia sp. NBRC 101731]